FRAAHALERDRPESHGRCVGEVDAVRDAYREVHRHRDQLGMVGDAGAGARDGVAGSEADDVLAGLDDDPRRRVADREAGVELLPDAPVRTEESVSSSDLEGALRMM